MPDPDLAAFHLRNSVFQNLVAAGLDESRSECSDDEICDVRHDSPNGELLVVMETSKRATLQGEHGERRYADGEERFRNDRFSH
jgi:hypothetical protein